jgi:predicted nucleotidyltransferase
MTPFARLARVLSKEKVRFVVIGVSGANFYVSRSTPLFATVDRDLFLPPDPENELAAWRACERQGLELWCSGEPLGPPRDAFAAKRVVERRLLVQATDGKGLFVDLTLVMGAFDFETVWKERRTFLIDGVKIPVARLSQIVASKAAAGRGKDQLFLSTHAEALRNLTRDDDERGPR